LINKSIENILKEFELKDDQLAKNDREREKQFLQRHFKKLQKFKKCSSVELFSEGS